QRSSVLHRKLLRLKGRCSPLVMLLWKLSLGKPSFNMAALMNKLAVLLKGLHPQGKLLLNSVTVLRA
ncbi:MAG: hypothetical protein EBT13_14570, partial [Rhodobacteraceae bacterium]|nr:hypothetical protein [Paracoccaceae bacterium]